MIHTSPCRIQAPSPLLGCVPSDCPSVWRDLVGGRLTWCCDTRSIPDPADVVAAPEVGLRGRRLPSAPDEDDVAEDDRNRTDLRTEVRAVLHLEMQVRHQRVARVPDSGDLLAEPHALSLAHPSASLLEVRQHCVAPTANIEEDVIASRGLLPDVADGL